MSDGMQLFIIFIFVIVMFSILNFLAISLSQHNFKRRIVADFLFSLLTPLVFLTTTAFASIFDKAEFVAGTLAFIVAIVYILNGIVILLSSLFFLKRNIT
ncbi:MULTISPECIES: hypothetical protein [Bacillus cereus group]|uniref:hypothetical protein n=1 Tax=Bacillus cereus group TaxID=86661 RepID=UPI0022E5196E|nr:MULTISPECIES: hypothetical protein [unclassified Bacillus cereus group]MDA2664400.1 hypothetical protein [Bacillus cereus group sp. Bc032]MDA2675088.1 hypothetical protein [Bacillus cereus group sp. Bc031]MDA2680506.1 hypothetical protein [Bacillus cereus group sp. Bc029]MDA2686026.1 hypothetical protein [Bacillus cereus group sp. Bc030]MDA2741514.1 hypothetical protein [Bacillus cereus group sp. Bc011]